MAPNSIIKLLFPELIISTDSYSREFPKNKESLVLFLMKYGWLIVIINIGVGAFYYFGSISHNSVFTSSSCNIQKGFVCENLQITPKGISLSIRNVKDIDIYNMKAKITDIDNIKCSESQSLHLESGQVGKFFVSCIPDIEPDSDIKGKIIISYDEQNH